MIHTLPAFEVGISAWFTDERKTPDTLLPAERFQVENAVEKRQHEFSTGRFCARTALAALGFENQVVTIGPAREPVWPAEVTGSISHTTALTGAIVAATSDFAGLGLDIETKGSVSRDIWSTAFTGREQRFLERLSGHERDLFATLLFSFKESFYKLQYPITRRFLEFDAVEISVENSGIRIEPAGTTALPEFVGRIRPAYHLTGDQVITWCMLRA